MKERTFSRNASPTCFLLRLGLPGEHHRIPFLLLLDAKNAFDFAMAEDVPLVDLYLVELGQFGGHLGHRVPLQLEHRSGARLEWAFLGIGHGADGETDRLCVEHACVHRVVVVAGRNVVVDGVVALNQLPIVLNQDVIVLFVERRCFVASGRPVTDDPEHLARLHPFCGHDRHYASPRFDGDRLTAGPRRKMQHALVTRNYK